MKKMNVVAFRPTGHVLGAATRATQADKPLTVDEVAAHGIAVRDGTGLRALIGKEHLTVALVNYDTSLIYRPQLYGLTEDLRAEPQNRTVVPTLVMTRTSATVTLPPPPGPTEVFLHVTGGALAQPLLCAVTVPAGSPSAAVGVVLDGGVYTVVVLAPGYATLIMEKTVA